MRTVPEEFEATIRDEAINNTSFNVMPGKKVKESLFIHEYRVANNYIEAVFDREYSTDMINSPSHLIFISVLIHWQKLVYVFFCHNQGVEYSVTDREKFKIWPTNIQIRLPKLVTGDQNLLHQCWFDSIKKLPNGSWHLKGETRVNSIVMTGDTIVMPVS